MAKEEKIQYIRMPGRPFSLFGVSSFWYGDDHLLLVESAFFKERYKRFFFKDIQSVALHRTGVHWVWTFVWGGIALLFGVIAALVPGTPYVSGAICALSFTALLVNLLMGPSCQVMLQTAVQRHRLSTLRRVKSAAKTMDRIKAFVEEHQGDWEKQKSIDIQKRQPSATPSIPQGPPVKGTRVIEEKVPVGPYRPLLHQITFGLLAAMGVLGVIQIVLKILPLGLLGSLLHAVIQIMVIVTLVRWHRHLKGTTIAKTNWLALIFISFHTAVGYVLYFVVSFRYPEINYHNWAMFKKMFEIQMMDHPLALSGNIIYAGGGLMLGVFGMLLVQRYAKSAKS